MKLEDQIHLSANLKALLEESEHSFTQVARKTGINRCSTFHSWVYGATPSSLVALVRLCEYFSVSLDKLCLRGQKTEKPSNQVVIHLQWNDQQLLEVGKVTKLPNEK